MAGPALTWAVRSDVGVLTVIAEAETAPALARRVSGIGVLDVEVLAVDGVALVPAEPAPVASPPELDPRMWELAAVLSEAGARPVDDHGRIAGEVAGLEVARIDPPGDDGVTIEVGVGEADRELHSLVHTQMDSDTAVRRAVAMVGAERRAGSLHPLARMARERWMRSVLLDDPTRIGLMSLVPAAPLVARSTVLGNVPSAAVGERADGTTVVVVCSSGIDLDLIPEAADYRRRDAAEAELLVVVPERDRHATTEALAALTPNCHLLGLAPPW